MKEKQTQEIAKENMIRIYDEELLKRLNSFYDRNKVMLLNKNKMFIDFIKLGLDLAEKLEKDRWAFNNETKTMMESIQFLTKRMNIFLKFSEHFIEETYANSQVNQDLACRVYSLLYQDCGDLTKAMLDGGEYDFLPKLLQEKKENLQAECHKRIAMWKKEKDEAKEADENEN